MAMKKLKEYLDKNHIKYFIIGHSPAFTTQQVAEAAHIPGKEVAKTVIIKLDGELAMIVLPAIMKVDLYAIKDITGASKVELASEYEFKDKFPEDCELGAMPPFGNLFGMKVFADRHLSEDSEIAFNAGSHTELIKLAYKDFERLVHPNML